MFKRIILALSFFAVSYCQAQNFFVGPSLGIGASQLHTSENTIFKPLVAANGGLRLGYNTIRFGSNNNNVLSLNADVLYQYHSMRYVLQLTDAVGFNIGQVNAQVRHTSLSVPLYASVFLGGKTHMVLEAGGYLNFLTRYVHYNPAFFTTSGKGAKTTSDGNMQLDAGLLGAMGMGWDLGERCHFDLTLRLTRGLVDQSSSPIFSSYHSTVLVRSSLVYKLGKAKAGS